jgi:UDP-N-acetylglucosamine 2-epimerase (non-hydrolysing)
MNDGRENNSFPIFRFNMKILNIVGARPNFIKIAPLMKEMAVRSEITPLLAHTGQHYDVKLAGTFFEDLGIPSPDVSLDVGSGSHAFQTAEVMKRIEPVMEQQRPELVLVVGDVNSTLAAAVTAAKLQIPVAHVEAGLRSFDRSMPEEINRLVTDAVSTYLFVSEESGMKNLAAEGADMARVFFVGNVMIDSLEASRRMWERSSIQEQLGVTKGQYGVLTLHRPSNVDQPAVLRGLLEAIAEIGREQPIVFPVHPRTRKRLEDTQEVNALLRFTGSGTVQGPGIWCLDPLGYLDFMALVAGARLILTDSGGIQEETTALGIPCLTLRENTERPVTISHGTNRLVGTSPEKIVEEAMLVLKGPKVAPSPPPLWDGHAAERIVSIILEQCR